MLLEAEHLTKDYGRYRALDDLNLNIRHGEIFGLLGPNGSGKSTTLRLILGFLKPTRGRVLVNGYDCWRESLTVRQMVTYLPGELRLYENMTGWQLLRFLAGVRQQSHALVAAGAGESHPSLAKGGAAGSLPPLAKGGAGGVLGPECERLARRFDLDLSRPIADLSSGMKRKLALLQVLVPKVPLLILDEPTNTLDPTMRDQLLDQLLEARSHGQTVLFSSHVLQEVDRVCDRVGILYRGRLVHVQDMNELREVRLARVRFADPPPPVPTLPGLSVETHRNGEWTVACRGDLQPLLKWLSGYAVADLRVEPHGLGPIYHRYHGEEK
jgi:ABC-2 type transport system ATP-binding protein